MLSQAAVSRGRRFIVTKAANSSRLGARPQIHRERPSIIAGRGIRRNPTSKHRIMHRESSPMYGTGVWNTTMSVIHFDEFAAFELPNRMQGPRTTGENPDHLALLGPNRALNRSK